MTEKNEKKNTWLKKEMNSNKKQITKKKKNQINVTFGSTVVN